MHEWNGKMNAPTQHNTTNPFNKYGNDSQRMYFYLNKTPSRLHSNDLLKIELNNNTNIENNLNNKIKKKTKRNAVDILFASGLLNGLCITK